MYLTHITIASYIRVTHVLHLFVKPGVRWPVAGAAGARLVS